MFYSGLKCNGGKSHENIDISGKAVGNQPNIENISQSGGEISQTMKISAKAARKSAKHRKYQPKQQGNQPNNENISQSSKEISQTSKISAKATRKSAK
ncbi:MAG: hypothetical protein E6778_21710, partial [Niallia nealsonii]|nr:hypothetical protein [Niallia nealsonii]